MTTNMPIPDISSFGHLLEHARRKASARPLRAALVVPSSQSWLSAFDRAIREGLVAPTVIGDKPVYEKYCRESGVRLPGVEVLDINQPEVAFATAAKMAVKGDLDLIVKGRGPTVDFLRIILAKENNFIPKGATLSHIGVIKPELYPKLLAITDAGVIPQPDLKTKVALIDNMARFFQLIGIMKPRLAVIAAVEAIYPGMPSTTDAAVLAKMSDRRQIKNAFVDGPLSFDIAIDLEAALAKGIKDSPVAGRADGMIAPNIETANGVFKAMALYGRAETGGILFGGAVPVALGNRWDSPVTRFNSIVLGVLACG